MPELNELIALFYEDEHGLGSFRRVAAEQLPVAARRLLAHEEHMTVTVEAFHGCQVDVQVLAVQRGNAHYCREILLRRQSDGRVVQYGIVRMNFAAVSEEVRLDIGSERIPLGRVLIEHDVLRKVQLDELWEIEPSVKLASLLELATPATVHGRTALIFCDGLPAVELLEIVTIP